MNLGKGRKIPFGSGPCRKTTIGTLRGRLRRMKKTSRTKSIIERALNGDDVDVSEYPRYVNPRRSNDRLLLTLRQYARKYDIFSFEDGVFRKKM